MINKITKNFKLFLFQIQHFEHMIEKIKNAAFWH